MIEPKEIKLDKSEKENKIIKLAKRVQKSLDIFILQSENIDKGKKASSPPLK